MLSFIYNLFESIWGSTGLPSKEELEKMHVVIVGGGYGGTELALNLLKMDIPFTLIDPKEFFHHNVAALRASVFPEWMKKTAINYQQTFNQNFVQGKVTKVDFECKQVHVDNGQVIDYSDVVIAVGSQGPFPGRTSATSLSKATADYQSLTDELEKANDIVIVGGGAVGVELAGEIADKYKMKNITIIHPSQELVASGLGDNFQNRVKGCLRDMNIKLVLDDRVDNLGDLTFDQCIRQPVRTQKGQELQCDLILRCTGLAPDNSMTKSILDPSKFDENNRLKVNEFLQIEDHVYGIGDCINTPEHKMAAHAATHANLVSSNLLKQVRGQAMTPYKPAFDGMLVTIGSYAGAGIINGWNFPSFVVGLVKGRSLFTSKYWHMMGQTVPSPSTWS